MAPERRLAFGGIADLYDRARPSYPPELADDVLEFARVGPGDRALEIGAGTGKATKLFAERGLEIVALEPSAEMARLWRANCSEYANVRIEQSDFESWCGESEPFRLLFSAQAWHWVSPEERYPLARRALEPGGTLAVFWNWPLWERCPFREELVKVYREAAPDLGGKIEPGPMDPANRTEPANRGDWREEIADESGFVDPEVRTYGWVQEYSTEEYTLLLRTHSDHILLPDEQRERLLDGVAGVIDEHGGVLALEYRTRLCMARTGA
jgi:SAM-dependent methyltransferase